MNVIPFKRPAAVQGDAQIYTTSQIALIKSVAWSMGFFGGLGFIAIIAVVAYWRR